MYQSRSACWEGRRSAELRCLLGLGRAPRRSPSGRRGEPARRQRPHRQASGSPRPPPAAQLSRCPGASGGSPEPGVHRALSSPDSYPLVVLPLLPFLLCLEGDALLPVLTPPCRRQAGQRAPSLAGLSLVEGIPRNLPLCCTGEEDPLPSLGSPPQTPHLCPWTAVVWPPGVSGHQPTRYTCMTVWAAASCPSTCFLQTCGNSTRQGSVPTARC